MIEVGEYIRTLDGFIDKVIIEYKGKCNNPNCYEKHISCETDYYCEQEIVKHSKNIIDLIEVGDYVNGEIVIYGIKKDNKHTKKITEYITVNVDYREYGEDYLQNKDIESIVTHEQFKSIEYRLEN